MAKVQLKNIKKVYPLRDDQKKNKKSDTSQKKSNLEITKDGVVAVQEFSIDIKDKEDLIDTLLETLESYEDENYENVAIIVKGKKELKEIAPELKKFTKILSFDREDLIYRGGRVIIPSYYAKGLEFDGVIVVNLDDETDSLVKYIMCTRALHRLNVINFKK